MTKHEEIARDNFLAGYNCAQAVFCAFEDIHGFDHDTSMRLISSFGGGMGRLREVCGSLSAALAVAGYIWGYSIPGDDEIKKSHYALVQEIAARFRAEHGTIICRELLAGIESDTSPTPSPRTEEYYKKRPCVRFVMTAARIIDELIAEKGLGESARYADITEKEEK